MGESWSLNQRVEIIDDTEIVSGSHKALTCDHCSVLNFEFEKIKL